MSRKYYEAYDLRYRQVHEKGLAWFDEAPTPIVGQTVKKYALDQAAPMLEIGCGEGRDAIALLRAGYTLQATDVSPHAVAYCKAKFPRWAKHFFCLDCLQEEPQEKYAFIYAVGVLHMLVEDDDRARFWRYIRRGLRKDGLALVLVMGEGDEHWQTDPACAFESRTRVHQKTGEAVEIASTSCRMVTTEELHGEIARAGLRLAEEGPAACVDFPAAWYVVVEQGE